MVCTFVARGVSGLGYNCAWRLSRAIMHAWASSIPYLFHPYVMLFCYYDSIPYLFHLHVMLFCYCYYVLILGG
jgi:hypothetical protein